MPKFGSAVDFDKIPALRFVPETSSSAPSSPVLGQFYVDTDDSRAYWWNGSAWFAFDDVVDGAVTAAKLGTGAISNTHVNASAAIAYSKLNLATSIVNNDVSGSAAIAYSKLNLATSIVDGDVSASAAIAKSKLALSNTIVNADINSSAAIAYSKLDLNGAVTNNDLAGSINASKLDATSLATTVKAYRLDEFANPTSSVSMNSQRLTNLGAPSASNDAVRLVDLQNTAAGIDIKPSVRATTTGNGTLASAFQNGSSIDGVTLVTGDRILIKDQSTGSQNGIYTVNASGAPTRTDDTITPNTFVFVEEGTTRADTAWMLTNNGTVVVGTTALTFAQFAGGGATYTADGQGIEVSANQFSLELDGTSLSKSSAGLRIGTAAAGAGLTESSGVLAVGAGTGITVNANDVAVNPAVVARKFSITTTGSAWSAGVAKTITHNLNNEYPVVQVYETTSKQQVFADVVSTGLNSITVTVAAGQVDTFYTVTVIG